MESTIRQNVMKKTTNKATIKHLYGVNANKVPNRTYRLPNGTYTTSHKKYLETWTKIGEEFGKIIDGTLFGCLILILFTGSMVTLIAKLLIPLP